MRRGLALGLLAAAGAYVRAQRVVQGVSLQFALEVGWLGREVCVEYFCCA